MIDRLTMAMACCVREFYFLQIFHNHDELSRLPKVNAQSFHKQNYDIWKTKRNRNERKFMKTSQNIIHLDGAVQNSVRTCISIYALH